MVTLPLPLPLLLLGTILLCTSSSIIAQEDPAQQIVPAMPSTKEDCRAITTDMTPLSLYLIPLVVFDDHQPKIITDVDDNPLRDIYQKCMDLMSRP
jgi:hypothetical protein